MRLKNAGTHIRRTAACLIFTAAAACTSSVATEQPKDAVSQTPTVSISPSRTIPHSLSPTLMQQPTVTKTKKPTKTEKPTRTITRTPTISQTPTALNPSPDPSILMPGFTPTAARIRLGRGKINQVAVSPDRTKLAVAGDTGLFLLSADTLQEIWSSPTSSRLTHVFFSEGGKTITAFSLEVYFEGVPCACIESIVRRVDVWNASNGALERTLPINYDTSWSAAVTVSGDGRYLAIKDDMENITLVWDLPAGRLVHRLELAGEFPSLSPDGQYLAAYDGNNVCVWNIKTGEKGVCIPDIQKLEALAYSPDGENLIGVFRGKIVLWDVHSGESKQQYTSRYQWMLETAVFSPDGKYLAAGDTYGRVILWDAVDGRLLGVQENLVYPSNRYHHVYGLSGLAFSADGRRLLVGTERGIFLLDPRTGEILTSRLEPFSVWEKAGFEDDGSALAAVMPGIISYRNIHTYAAMYQMEFPLTSILSPDFHRYAVLSPNDDIQVISTRTGKILHVLRAPGTMSGFFFSPEDAIVAIVNSGSDFEVVDFWDLQSGRWIHSLEFPTTYTYAHSWLLQFSPDGRRVALSAEGEEHGGSIMVYDAQTFQPINEFYTDGLPLFALSSDGTRIASQCNYYETSGDICMYDISSGATLQSFNFTRIEAKWLDWEKISSVSFSPNRPLLAIGTRKGRLILWDTRSGNLLIEGKGHNQIVTGISFSPDGQTMASTSYDGTVVVWDLKGIIDETGPA